ncbi:MAG: hypothetical protein VR72_21915 [Clostridiaceae bacterium BRH_c20a]|nr:MAG: hypothetical protein VR72_21915 [Clostridiaceae bacterium BRH_c20a]
MINIQLQVKVPWGKLEIDEIRSYAEGTTVEKILADLGIEVKDEGNFLVAVNGKIEYKDYIFKDGDRISILPALIGG